MRSGSIIKVALEDLKGRLERAAAAAGLETDDPSLGLMIPSDPAHGDFATNLALSSGRGRNPRELAQELACHIPPGGILDRVEVAGPGFINFYLALDWLTSAVDLILRSREAYGNGEYGRGQNVNLEFVSANPTGPLGVVNARAAAVGDSLRRVMEATGYQVISEFYVNDAGQQVKNLAESIEARLRELEGRPLDLPEDGYPGEYLVEVARAIFQEEGGGLWELPEEERLDFLGRRGVQIILQWHQKALDKFDVTFDVWFSERSLRASGAARKTLETLAERGFSYEEEGAVWLKTTAYGDDKDRVLVKADGELTYLAADLAYHLNKLDRGFDTLINIWGPDHHGAIPRMYAGLRALGKPAEVLEILICQLVNLIRGGQRVRMSKRAGDIIDMEEFLEEAGRDAARFFFLMRSLDSHLDFDLDLTQVQGSDNPVYYVQYAHARMASILRTAAGEGLEVPGPGEFEPGLLSSEPERALLRHLARLPEVVEEAARAREPHRLTAYARDLATAFHGFYTECRVLGVEEDLTLSRLALVKAAGLCLKRSLNLLGVEAPERM